MESPEDFPKPIRCIYERLKDDGIYLLGIILLFYLNFLYMHLNLDKLHLNFDSEYSL